MHMYHWKGLVNSINDYTIYGLFLSWTPIFEYCVVRYLDLRTYTIKTCV